MKVILTFRQTTTCENGDFLEMPKLRQNERYVHLNISVQYPISKQNLTKRNKLLARREYLIKSV